MKQHLLLLLILSTIFAGCSFRNPFSPPVEQLDIYQNSSSSTYEPIQTKAMYRATMKPYTVAGIKYTPIIPKVGQTFQGIASWYGPNFHGKQTSNGEYYDMYSSTAAHKTLPMNTKILVTNLDNNTSTIVRINDRGPFVQGRIIDLSHQAATELGMIDKGTANIKLEVLSFDPTATAYQPAVNAQNNTLHNKILKQKNALASKASSNSIQSVLYKVQLLSTSDKQSAQKFAQDYATIDDRYHVSIRKKTFWQKTTYKVIIGDFLSAKAAQNFIAENYFNDAFVIKD